jgi:hypothetical protein
MLPWGIAEKQASPYLIILTRCPRCLRSLRWEAIALDSNAVCEQSRSATVGRELRSQLTFCPTQSRLAHARDPLIT